MSGAWLILKTEYHRERQVVASLNAQGFDAWHPIQVKMVRSAAHRRFSSHAMPMKRKDFAILPTIVFAAIPVAVHGVFEDLGHKVAVERGNGLEPLLVPFEQIKAFRAEIDQMNAHTLAASTLAQSRKQKTRWRTMQEALNEIVNQSKQQMEIAA